MEKTIYEELLTSLNKHLDPLIKTTKSIAQLDGLTSLARISLKHGYCRPEFTKDNELSIQDGRHPVVETQIGNFIPNSVDLKRSRNLLLITGPNMGGKSTFMRQTALIVLMAHIGCFVPATSAKIGKFDQIFSRIGASDDLSGGKSTFMVEMTEAANILNNSTTQSLILMDEIGRGTSTYDGVALASAITSYIVKNNKSLTLFATHYFELTQLAKIETNIKNVHVSAKEYREEIIFLHQIKEGAASQSYGIEVARLAGLPQEVLSTAKENLKGLQLKNPQKELFGTNTLTKPAQSTQHPALKKLQHLNPDHISPKDAINILYDLLELTKK